MLTKGDVVPLKIELNKVVLHIPEHDEANLMLVKCLMRGGNAILAEC